MFSKYMTAGLLGSAMLVSAAFAQSATTTTAPAATATPAAPLAASDATYTGNWRASKVVGLNVYNSGNESLGSINDLLTDKQGNIKAVVVGVGGFLGVGEHLVAVPFDKIKFVNEPVVTASAAGGGAAGSSGMTGARPSSTTTTGAAPAATTASKPNPWYPDHAVLDATKDQLKAMPEFKYSN
ncbi:PRC-barrel domain-containing protein [Rhodopseudomonas sp. P2A-2r]|uniref:PRC-barrel domain-containing protein n=1 Tax=Rhodopseudomonas sp. P2A-2r TaxID=2991972 RepID=UPI002234BE61|nr:PRC-barrel domain-containing protein [Rhodopseudomonas sp. P2A-2r]UZE48555.1 PRC-barrel domain-containing protein [Rhodopseudomonas sp. P2A-2r]